MRRIIVLSLFFLVGYISITSAGLIKEIGIIEDTDSRLKMVVKSGFQSYNALLLSSPTRLLINLSGCYLDKKQPSLLKPKGKIISKIYIGKRKKGVRIVLYPKNRRSGFKYKIASKGEYLIITCWPKGRKIRFKEGEYMPLPQPLKSSKKLLALQKRKEAGPDYRKSKIPKYTGKKVSLEFYKADLHNVFRLFSEISGKNIIVSDKVKGTLTLSLKNVPWDFALDLILEVENLKKEERLNTYIITPIEKKEKGKGELIVKKVSDKTIHLARVLKEREKERRKAQQIILKAYELEKKGKTLKALTLYEKAANLWKDNADLLKKCAYLYYSTGNFSRAHYFANKALKINPDDAEAALYGALSAVKLDKIDDANIMFGVAIKGTPKIPEAYYDYALFLQKQKDYIHALSIYEEYEDLFGPILQTSLAIAKIYDMLGDEEKACKKYREIILSGFKVGPSTKKRIKDNINKLCSKKEKPI